MRKNQKKYNFAVIATDVAIFTVQDNTLKVLLIKMKKKPFMGSWALPGGLIRPDDTPEKSAKQHLVEKTGVKGIYLEQLYTFGRVNRDPFGRVVSVAYMALIPHGGLKLKTSSAYDAVKWFPIKNLPRLAYDHKEIIEYALERLRTKLEYTNIVYSLMPDEFTLSDLQTIYEVILSKKLDKRNFRKKLLSVGLVKQVRKKQMGFPHRPAELYRFVQRKPQIVDIL